MIQISSSSQSSLDTSQKSHSTEKKNKFIVLENHSLLPVFIKYFAPACKENEKKTSSKSHLPLQNRIPTKIKVNPNEKAQVFSFNQFEEQLMSISLAGYEEFMQDIEYLTRFDISLSQTWNKNDSAAAAAANEIPMQLIQNMHRFTSCGIGHHVTLFGVLPIIPESEKHGEKYGFGVICVSLHKGPRNKMGCSVIKL